jgi:ribokinase
MKFDVVSFGSAVIDVFVHTNVASKHNFLHYPVGSKMLIDDLRFDVGGGGTNTSVAFARLGLKAGCISSVGQGTNANNFITRKDIRPFKTKWMYCSSMLEKSFQTQKSLCIKLAKEGVKIGFNPSSYHIKNEDLTEFLTYVHFLIVNKEEAENLTKKYRKQKDLLIALSELGPKIVVITDNHRTVRCLYEGKEYNIKPHSNLRVVEMTGAGDAFASGVVAGLIVDLPIKKCLELGLKESESVIQHLGAKNNLIRRKLL